VRPIGIVAALATEAATLGRAKPQGSVYQLGDGSLVAISGIGANAAQKAAERLAEQGAGALLSWGLAGGLDPALVAGNLLLPCAVLSPRGARLLVTPDWHARLAAALTPALRFNTGDLLTNPVAIDSSAAKAAAFRATNAVAVDMESFAIAEEAATRRLPFATVRVIVDTAGDSLPPAVTATSRAGRVDIARLLWELLRAPADLGALLRLAARYRAAMRSLTLAARTGLSAPPVSTPRPA
jgi:adenosylhomocysteine nucleosidase